MNGGGPAEVSVAEKQERLALSEYEGWVAWAGDTPVFEARAYKMALAPLEPGADPQYRRPSRNTIDWDELEHEKITELELYFARDQFAGQPVIRLTRWPDAELRWIQMKMRGIQVEAGIMAPQEPNRDANVQRTRVQGYRVGYYNRAMRHVTGPPKPETAPTMIFEVTRDGKIKRRYLNAHPCWPKPHGLGYNPKVLGLEPGDVPPAPATQADMEREVRQRAGGNGR